MIYKKSFQILGNHTQPHPNITKHNPQQATAKAYYILVLLALYIVYVLFLYTI